MGGTENTALAALMTEARWGNGQFARAVNRTAAESGLTLSYDASSVSHWLNGSVPRAEARPAVAEALSRRVGRVVTYAEIGFPGADTNRAAALADLVRHDMDPTRRGVLAGGLYSAALAVPAFSELGDRLGTAHDAGKAGRTVRVGSGEVTTVRRMTDHIATALDDLGGGHARPMAAAFLANTVLPWLEAGCTPKVRGELLAAASDFVYLTGWMAMYERSHGLGQRYFLQALRLAEEGGDQVTYCRTLRGMALQAASLRHGAKALELADSAAEAAPAAGPRLVAFLRGQQAHGAALVGDRRQAFGRLRETEEALSRADGRNDAVGGYDEAAYQFHVSGVLYALGDLPGSIRAMRRSNRARPAHERQGRLHAHGVLAARQWEHGHIDGACETWDRFLTDYAALSTSRGDEHFARLRRLVARRAENRAVRQLRERAEDVARRKAAA
ncbi:hypothetical protein [Streptomyces zingiberis]|uniref:Regulatory protein n=1 Tax=Streptomyces zingiberis TaxID=2053010 RepID=A0ABX1BZ87_9ACTN|nr:hypothetical protein [Streptomyces zingiberis]NJQ01195.1 hypothetical protein [Streptomyces zingiberis]